jgi:GNAT superfamily N-acetyltransferase
MEIRQATPDDARAIAEVHVRTWQIAYVEFVSAEFLTGLAQLLNEPALTRRRQALEDPGQTTLVAEEDGRILGFAAAGLNRDDLGPNVGELYAIYVHPKAWDQGVGTRLITHAEAILVEAGYQRAILWTLGANARTRRFYENRGWRFEGTSYLHEASGTERVRYEKELSQIDAARPEP